MSAPLALGSRRELFVDRLLVETLAGVDFRLHAPQLAPPVAPTICGHYMTVFQDGARHRAYFRQYDPTYTGETYDGNVGEYTAYAESGDGITWTLPDLGQCEVQGSRHNSAVLRQAPFCHNFAPFRDANPAAPPAARYKALAGTHPKGKRGGDGLHAFQSPDGLHWAPLAPAAVLTHDDFAFDSQNVSFWSVAEEQYVCYFRTWVTPHGRLRTISRSTSPDFVHWTPPVPLAPNLPGEHLYTSQTHPYCRAPHLYLALPTRFQPDRGSSTDILFMVSRAGSERYERLCPEAFIRPGLDPQRWGNRSNYAACGVLPTGPAELSIYHGPAGRRYTLRTDGFISLHAGFASGNVTTRAFTFAGAALSLNLATSAAGSVRVELQDEQGQPLPGRALTDCPPIFTDAIAHTVAWRDGSDLATWTGRPVRLRFELREADVYAMQFQ